MPPKYPRFTLDMHGCPGRTMLGRPFYPGIFTILRRPRKPKPQLASVAKEAAWSSRRSGRIDQGIESFRRSPMTSLRVAHRWVARARSDRRCQAGVIRVDFGKSALCPLFPR
jgi:hypothetical protein